MQSHTRMARAALLTVAVLTFGCGPAAAPAPSAPATPAPAPSPPPSSSETSGKHAGARATYEVGLASWYGRAFAGKKTASGERFDPHLFTAAHKRLPFGTWVEVRRVDTGRSVRVRINDRGPNGRAAHRIIDLSQRAAEELDIIRAGVVRVELRIVGAER